MPRLAVRAGWVIASLTLAIGTGLYLEQHFPPYLIWGGSDCVGQTDGVMECFGYPPSGIMALLFGSFMFLYPPMRAAERLFPEPSQP